MVKTRISSANWCQLSKVRCTPEFHLINQGLIFDRHRDVKLFVLNVRTRFAKMTIL